MSAAEVHRIGRDELEGQPINLTPTLPPLTVQQAAPVLAVSTDAVYDAVARGEINALRLGRAIRIPRAEIARLLGIAND